MQLGEPGPVKDVVKRLHTRCQHQSCGEMTPVDDVVWTAWEEEDDQSSHRGWICVPCIEMMKDMGTPVDLGVKLEDFLLEKG